MHRALAGLGLLLCILGIALVAGAPPPFSRLGLAQGLGAFLVVWGAAALVLRHRPATARVSISLISLALLGSLVGEAAIRAAMRLGHERARDPGLYADALSDDDYWKLRYRWNPNYLATTNQKRFVPDPLLGWSPPRSLENPLGIVSDEPYEPGFGEPTVLFYGDSFVYGAMLVPVHQRIPQQLDRLLPTYQVHNYGVSAYGVDQIYLRFRETHHLFERPLIIFGVLTQDLDRSVLDVHCAPKPRFELTNGELELRNTPIPEDHTGWYAQNPVALRSYFLALVRRAGDLAGGDERLEEKQAVNTRLIEAVVEEARARELPLLFVIFYHPDELERESWREVFLTDLFQRLDVPYIDTKAVLRERAREHSIAMREFYLYRRGNDHLNELGSCVVAAAVAEYVAGHLSAGEIPIRRRSCF